MIAPAEYQLAILTIIAEAVAIERDDLVVETARLFGFDRTGPDLKEAIDKQTAMLVKTGRLQLDGDILRLEARGVRQNTESPPIPRDVSALIVPGRHELPRIAGVNYVGFVDPSGGSADSMTLAIAHVESDAAGAKRAVVDLIREVRPPFNPDAVVAEFASAEGVWHPQREGRSLWWHLATRPVLRARR